MIQVDLICETTEAVVSVTVGCLFLRVVFARTLRRATARPDRGLVFGHARRQELRSPMPSAIADLAGTDRRAAEAAAETYRDEIRHRASTDPPPLSYLSLPFAQSAETACASRYSSTAASCPSARIAS